MFSRIKIYILSTIVGGLIGLTISGFWPGLLNRCSACGRLVPEKHTSGLMPKKHTGKPAVRTVLFTTGASRIK